MTSAILNTDHRDNLLALRDTVQGDLGTTGLIQKHLSGTLAARPAAGNVGRVYLATDTVELDVDFGAVTGWIKQLSIPDMKNYWFYTPAPGGPMP